MNNFKVKDILLLKGHKKHSKEVSIRSSNINLENITEVSYTGKCLTHDSLVNNYSVVIKIWQNISVHYYFPCHNISQ